MTSSVVERKGFGVGTLLPASTAKQIYVTHYHSQIFKNAYPHSKTSHFIRAYSSKMTYIEPIIMVLENRTKRQAMNTQHRRRDLIEDPMMIMWCELRNIMSATLCI